MNAGREVCEGVSGDDGSKECGCGFTRESAIKFLIESAFKEASLVWRRNSVYFALNVAGLASLKLLASDGPADLVTGYRFALPVFGLISCVIWWQTIVSGFKMNHVWVAAAKWCASTTTTPPCECVRFAILNTPTRVWPVPQASGDVPKGVAEELRIPGAPDAPPAGASSKGGVRSLILAVVAAWLAVLLWAILAV